MSFESKHYRNKNNEITIIEIFNKNSLARIVLNQGASLDALMLKGTEIVKNLNPLTYKDTYASAILFPFANRIKDGQYTYKNKQCQLTINEPQRNNAIHGLLYNKVFEIEEEVLNNNEAKLVLAYKETKKSLGFPYSYKVQLEYNLTENNLSLKANFTNTSNSPFPFTYGWHPYFYSENLSKSTLHFNSTQRVVFNDQMIFKGLQNLQKEEDFPIENKVLDNCYKLNDNKVLFSTPKYQLEISTTSKEIYLQIYTPPIDNFIAIEPVSGVSDSFNNKFGLKELNPQETYSVKWDLKIISHQ